MRIGVDLLGSESSPEVLFEAVLQEAKQLDHADSLVVYVTQDTVDRLLPTKIDSALPDEGASKIDLHIVEEFIQMDEEPLSAIRSKKRSSLAVGIQQLGERKIDAFVTAGNTGALIACATIRLSPLKGIDRSALLAVLPTQNCPLAMLDVGGNVSCKAQHLIQYAHIGAAYQRCSLGLERPTVGLLNIGVESKKGTPEVREAYKVLLEQSSAPESKIRFVGNIEGREAFQGKVDVLVCDGFTGNVMLKTSEGISAFIFEYLQKSLKGASSEELHRILDEMQRHFSYDEYPGAIVCGVDGVVVKCHGAATQKAMQNSIRGAMVLVRNRLLERIKEELIQLKDFGC